MQVYLLVFIATFAFCFADECPDDIKYVQATITDQFCRVPVDKLEDYKNCSSADDFDLEPSFLACSRGSSDFAQVVDMKTFHNYLCVDSQAQEVARFVCCTLSVELKGTMKTIQDKADTVKMCSEKMLSDPQ